MYKKLIVAAVLVGAAFVTGCASVPMASPEQDTQAKSFGVKPDKANIYVYRNESMGAAVKLPVVLDGKIVGDTAAKTFMLLEVSPGKHKLVSKGETDSALELATQPSKNYFVWQEVKMGAWAASSKLQVVDEAAGKAGVAECKLAEIQN
jgi:PBP1b-binding outer membrane lipoprotein LpoB